MFKSITALGMNSAPSGNVQLQSGTIKAQVPMLVRRITVPVRLGRGFAFSVCGWAFSLRVWLAHATKPYCTVTDGAQAPQLSLLEAERKQTLQ